VRVCLSERPEELRDDVHHARDGQVSASFEELTERFAIEDLGDDEELPIIGVARVEEPNGVRVFEHAGRTRFVVEAADDLRLGGDGWPQHLQRDRAVCSQLPCSIDRAHSALSKDCVDAIAAIEDAADERRRIVLALSGR
jgi:hypothetical protein